MTASLSVSRFGDRMNAIGRSLTGRAAAASLAVLAILSGVATYAWLAGLAPAAFGTTGWITGLLVADLVIAIVLVAVLATRISQLWLDRRRGAAGSRLHMRLVLMCSIFTIAPTLIIAIIQSLLVINLADFVVKPAQDSYKAAANSFESARAIGEPVRRARESEILRDIAAISTPLQERGIDALRDKEATTKLLEQLIAGRPEVIEADVIEVDKGLLARAVAPDTKPIANPVPPAQFIWQAVNHGGPVQLESQQGAYFVMQLFVSEPYFLVTGHNVDLRVVDYIKSIEVAGKRMESAGEFYAQINGALQRSQVTIFVVCGAIALLMLLAAVWLAILFATKLTEPIGGLMSAAEQMRGGNLAVRVAEGPPNDELGQLARSFNRMASQIEQQRGELVDANKELDTRRRLTDAVLAGVSAGVLSVDGAGIISRGNRSALELLALPEDGVIGRQLIEVMPELAPLAVQAAERPERVTQGQVEILQRGARRTLLVRISRVGRGFGRHVRRRHRPDVGPAHGRLGRRGPTHRSRDQESADSDPAFRRASQAPLPQADQGGSRDLLDLHRHHHPPGRRHRPHGRRVLILRPHAATDGAARGCQGALPAGVVPAAQRQCRDPLQGEPARSSGVADL